MTKTTVPKLSIFPLSGPKETPSPQILLVRQKPAFLRYLSSWFPSTEWSRTDKWLGVVPVR